MCCWHNPCIKASCYENPVVVVPSNVTDGSALSEILFPPPLLSQLNHFSLVLKQKDHSDKNKGTLQFFFFFCHEHSINFMNYT